MLGRAGLTRVSRFAQGAQRVGQRLCLGGFAQVHVYLRLPGGRTGSGQSCREHQNADTGEARTHALGNAVAVLARQVQVQDQGVCARLGERCIERRAAVHAAYLKALFAQVVT